MSKNKYEQKLLRFDKNNPRQIKAFECLQNKPPRFSSLSAYVTEAILEYEEGHCAASEREENLPSDLTVGTSQEELFLRLENLVKQTIKQELMYHKINLDPLEEQPTEVEENIVEEVTFDSEILGDIGDFIGI
ncbi:hypothetical protein M2145_002563 [Lachnospiraceae bacterium PF1-21]